MRWAILCGLLLLGGCTHGTVFCTVQWEPPQQYDHVPDPMPVLFTPDYWDVDSTCRSTGYIQDGSDNGRITGCALYIDPPFQVPAIVVPKVDGGYTQDCQNLEIEHEWGHINGWPANHPGARSVR